MIIPTEEWLSEDYLEQIGKEAIFSGIIDIYDLAGVLVAEEDYRDTIPCQFFGVFMNATMKVVRKLERRPVGSALSHGKFCFGGEEDILIR